MEARKIKGYLESCGINNPNLKINKTESVLTFVFSGYFGTSEIVAQKKIPAFKINYLHEFALIKFVNSLVSDCLTEMVCLVNKSRGKTISIQAIKFAITEILADGVDLNEIIIALSSVAASIIATRQMLTGKDTEHLRVCPKCRNWMQGNEFAVCGCGYVGRSNKPTQ